MTFRTWLLAQAWRGDGIGDLARDAKADAGLPARLSTRRFTVYLESQGACDAACACADRAISEWQSQRGRP